MGRIQCFVATKISFADYSDTGSRHVSVMAVDRLKGVGKFLQQCRGADDFSAIQKTQHTALLQELGQLRQASHEECASMISLLKEMDLTEEMKDALVKLVQEKAGFNQSTRVILQQWKFFPEFLKEGHWLRLTNPGLQSQALTVHLKLLMEHLYKLGLRAPSEDTFAMITTLLLLTDQGRFSDSISLRSAYLSCKSQARHWLQILKHQKTQPNHPRLQELPKSAADLDPERLKDVFGEGCGAAPLPDQLTMETLLHLCSLVPQRSSRLTTQLQIPRSVAVRGHSAVARQFAAGVPALELLHGGLNCPTQHAVNFFPLFQ